MRPIKRAIEVYKTQGFIPLLIRSLYFILKNSFLIYPVYHLTKIHSRDENILVFSGHPSGKEFSDNCKYLYLHLQDELDDDTRLIWLSRDKSLIKQLRQHGFESYHTYGFKGVYYCLKAKYIIVHSVITSLNWWCVGGAKIVQLWHGLPIKTIGKDSKRSVSIHTKLRRKIVRYDYWCAASDLDAEIYPKVKNVKEVIVTGFPRTDIFYRDIPYSQIGSDLSHINKDINGSMIAYLPTYRDYSNCPPPIDYESLQNLLSETDSILLLKCHRYMNVPKIDQYDRIIQIDNGIDIYPHLNSIDVLVTDYSSIYFDYLHTDGDIIFYAYDYDEFKERRGFFFDYQEITPGPIAYNYNELESLLKSTIRKDSDKIFVEKKEQIKNKAIKHLDGKSSERIYNRVVK